MTVRVESRTVFTLRCRECGFNQTVNHEHEATKLAREHEDRHTASQVVGKQLEGKVFDSTRAYFGHIGRAQKVALAEGFAFMEWNGHVYTTSHIDTRNPLAWAKDVPGLVAA